MDGLGVSRRQQRLRRARVGGAAAPLVCAYTYIHPAGATHTRARTLVALAVPCPSSTIIFVVIDRIGYLFVTRSQRCLVAAAVGIPWHASAPPPRVHHPWSACPHTLLGMHRRGAVVPSGGAQRLFVGVKMHTHPGQVYKAACSQCICCQICA